MPQTIKEIKALLDTIDSIETLEQHELMSDTRKGVQQNIVRRRKQLLKRSRNTRTLSTNE